MILLKVVDQLAGEMVDMSGAERGGRKALLEDLLEPLADQEEHVLS